MIQTKYFSTYQSLYARVLRTGRKRYIARKPSKSLQRCETNLGCTQNRSNVLGFTNTTLCTAQLQTPCHNTLRERFLWKSSFSQFFSDICMLHVHLHQHFAYELVSSGAKIPRLTDSSPVRTFRGCPPSIC